MMAPRMQEGVQKGQVFIEESSDMFYNISIYQRTPAKYGRREGTLWEREIYSRY